MTYQIDEIGALIVQKHADEVENYNNLVQKSKAVDSFDDFREHFVSTNPQFKDFNDQIEKLESQLESLKIRRLAQAEPLVDAAYKAALADTGVDLTALDEMLKKINSTKRYLTQVYGEEALENIPPVEKRKSSSAGSNSGEGGRRIRGFNVYVDGVLAGAKNKDGVFKSTFSAASKMVGVETGDLQSAFFEAADSTDPSNENFPNLVEFNINDHAVKAERTVE